MMKKKLMGLNNYFVDYFDGLNKIIIRLHFNEKGLTKFSFPKKLEYIYDEEYNEEDPKYVQITTMIKLYKTRKFSNFCKYTSHYSDIQAKLEGNSF